MIDRMRPPRRRIVPAVVCATLIALAGCAGGSSPLPKGDHPTQARALRPLTQVEVNESMTTLAELPQGYAVDPKGQLTELFVKGTSATAIPARCTAAIRAEQNFNIFGAAFAKGRADFTDGKSHLVGVTIYSFQSPYRVGTLSDDLTRAVGDCPTVTYPDSPGFTTTASLFRTAGLGDESIGMLFRTTSASQGPVEQAVEITRVGDFDLLTTALEADDGKADTTLLDELTRAAVGRLL